jgi:hypothetical protein
MPRDQGQDIRIQEIVSQVPSFSTLPSWMEWFGARLAAGLLLCIVVLVGGFVLAWWSTQPSLAEVAQVLGDKPEAGKLLETFTQLRVAHSKWVLDFFQPVVVTTLVPLFTLLPGMPLAASNAKTIGRESKHEPRRNLVPGRGRASGGVLSGVAGECTARRR